MSVSALNVAASKTAAIGTVAYELIELKDYLRTNGKVAQQLFTFKTSDDLFYFILFLFFCSNCFSSDRPQRPKTDRPTGHLPGVPAAQSTSEHLSNTSPTLSLDGETDVKPSFFLSSNTDPLNQRFPNCGPRTPGGPRRTRRGSAKAFLEKGINTAFLKFFKSYCSRTIACDLPDFTQYYEIFLPLECTDSLFMVGVHLICVNPSWTKNALQN